MYFIFCLFISLLILGIIAIVSYFLTRPLTRRWRNKGKLTAKQYIRILQCSGVIFILLAIWLAYSAAFPGRSFYASEFKLVTGVTLPSSAKISATALVEPDLHGHECIVAQFTMLSEDYHALLQIMEKKTEVVANVSPQNCSTLRTILGDTTVHKISYGFRRKNEGTSHHTLYIGFYASDTSVVIHHCYFYPAIQDFAIRR